MVASGLPVVAMRSVPHIYRRAAFPHRATPEALPLVNQPALRQGGWRLIEESFNISASSWS